MRDVLTKLGLILYNLGPEFLLDVWVFGKNPHHCGNGIGRSVGTSKNEGSVQGTSEGRHIYDWVRVTYDTWATSSSSGRRSASEADRLAFTENHNNR